MDSRSVAIAKDLAAQGWSVQANAFPADLCLALRDDIERLRQVDGLRKSDIGRGDRQTRAPSIRGDYIQWIDDLNPTPVQASLLSSCYDLYSDLGRQMFLTFNGFECHYAYYPDGARYQKHLDRFQDGNSRLLSLVLYLNSDWQEQDGGELEIYSEKDPMILETIVPPTMGTAAVFLSGSIHHAVRPTKRPRYSVSGWIRHDANPLSAATS